VRRIEFVVFSFLVLGSTFLIIFGAKPERKGALLLLAIAALLVAYLWLCLCASLSARTRTAVRIVPLALVAFTVGGLIVMGFLVAILDDGFSWGGPAYFQQEGVLGSQDVRIIPFFVLLMGIVLVFLAFASVKGLLQAARVRHHVSKDGVRFFTKKGAWEIAFADGGTLVVGEMVVLVCEEEDDEAVVAAVERLSRPSVARWRLKALEGVVFLDTDRLVQDLRAVGLRPEEVRDVQVIALKRTLHPLLRPVS
jgi:hypothetical protein